MELEEAFKLGILYMPSQSFLRKSWVKRFCALYSASSHGIQRLEIFESDSAFMKLSKSPYKIIPLTDCVKVTPAPQKQQANVFEVCTKTCSHQFSADSFLEMTEWLTALQTVSFGTIFSSGLTVPQFVIQDIKHEENMLYSSVDQPEIYSVKSLNTDAMLRNKLHGDYKLIVTSVGISITEDKPQSKTGKPVLTWPYRHIRRYGCSKDNFSFEAGRKCLSGEGLFAFSSPDSSVIFQSVDSHLSSLKLSQCDNDVPLSPSQDDQENSFFPSKESMQKVKGSNFSFVGESPNQRKFQECSGTEKKLETEKPVAKFSYPKPPRKSKANAYVNVQKNADENYDCFELATSENFGASSSNVYENPLDNYSAGPIVSDRTSALTYEPIYAVLEAESTSVDSTHLSNNFKNIQISDDSNINDKSKPPVLLHNQNEVTDDCYDHLSLKKFDNARASLRNHTSEHIYGKLLPNRPTSSTLESYSASAYGSVKSVKKNLSMQEKVCADDHCYTNVSIQERCDSFENEPKHILQNNAEYARVFKNKKSF